MKTTILKAWLVSVLLAALAPMAIAADQAPSGTVVIAETQVMLLVGGDAGGGTLVLHSNGDVRKFKIKGIRLGGIGVQKIHMTGEVYNLTRTEDFEGKYFSAEAGAAFVKGGGGLWLKNARGVVLHLKSSAEGLALALGVEGLDVKFTS